MSLHQDRIESKVCSKTEGKQPFETSFLRRLASELATWKQEQIISPELYDRLLDRYQIAARINESNENKTQRAILTILSLASLLMGLAVLLVVCFNWNQMTATLKLTILFSSLGLTHSTAMFLRGGKKTVSSEVAFFFASLLFGVCIWQIAQIFHISSHYPQGMFIWGVGTLALAIFLQTPLLHLLAAVLLAIWCGWEILGYEISAVISIPLPWISDQLAITIPHCAATLPVFVAIGLSWGYRKKTVTVVAIYSALLLWWLALACDTLDLRWVGIWYVLFLGIFYWVLGDLQEETMGKPWKIYGFLLTVGTLIPLSYFSFYSDFNRYYIDRFSYFTMMTNLGVGIAIVFFYSLALYPKIRAKLIGKKENSVPTPIDLLGARTIFTQLEQKRTIPSLLLVCCAVATFLATTNLFTVIPNDLTYLGLTLTVNAAMVILAWYGIMTGIARHQMNIYLGGVLYFLLWTTLRYFDLFAGLGSGGMLQAAGFFALCAICLGGTVLYWHFLNKKHSNEEILP